MGKLRIVVALLGLFLGLSQAVAADLTDERGSYEPPMAPIWGGLYVGGHIGGLWTGEDSLSLTKRCKDNCYCWWCENKDWHKVENKKYSTDGEDDVSLLGGLHIGYNVQEGSMVYGIEADASFGDRVDYLASLRARVGVAFNELLIYATAGVAFAGFDDNQVYGKTWWGKSYKVGSPDDGDTRIGFVVGGGAEYKLAPNWSVGLEGLYYAFADRDDDYSWEKYCKEYNLNVENDNDMYVVRARLTYHMQDAYEAPLK